MLVGIRNPHITLLCVQWKLRAGVTPKHTPMLQNAQQKTKHQIYGKRVRKAHPSGMQNKSLQNILSVILRDIISMCDMGDKEMNTDFSGLV